MIKKYFRGYTPPPEQKEFRMVETVDEHGVSIVTFVEYDHTKVDFGSLNDWSFDNLSKAGIEPPVMGGFSPGTNQEQSNILDEFSNNIDKLNSVE